MNWRTTVGIGATALAILIVLILLQLVISTLIWVVRLAVVLGVIGLVLYAGYWVWTTVR